MTSIDNVKKSKKIGRPSVDTEAVTLRLSKDTIQKIDDWRRFESDMPTRPEAIRRLLDAGLGIPIHADNLISQIERSSLAYVMAHDEPQAQAAFETLKKVVERYYRDQSGSSE